MCCSFKFVDTEKMLDEIIFERDDIHKLTFNLFENFDLLLIL